MIEEKDIIPFYENALSTGYTQNTTRRFVVAYSMPEFLDIDSYNTVLDAGCGRGAFSLWVPSTVKLYYGVDARTATIRAADSFYGRKNMIFSNIWPTEKFDIVFALGLIRFQYIKNTRTFKHEINKLFKQCVDSALKAVVFTIPRADYIETTKAKIYRMTFEQVYKTFIKPYSKTFVIDSAALEDEYIIGIRKE